MFNSIKVEVPPENRPQGLGHNVRSFISAGGHDRQAARRMTEAGKALIEPILEKSLHAQQQVKQALEDLHLSKLETYQTSVARLSKAYVLLDAPDRMDARILPEAHKLSNIPPVPAAPSISSGIGALLVGSLVGGALGGMVGFGALAAGLLPTAVAPAVIGSAVIVVAMAGAMCSGVRDGVRKRDAAIMFAHQSDLFSTQANNSSIRLMQVHASVYAMRSILNLLFSQIIHSTGNVQTIVTDATNAAALLKSILNTPLLGDDGALLENVIEKMHAQKANVDAFAKKLATAA